MLTKAAQDVLYRFHLPAPSPFMVYLHYELAVLHMRPVPRPVMVAPARDMARRAGVPGVVAAA